MSSITRVNFQPHSLMIAADRALYTTKVVKRDRFTASIPLTTTGDR